MKLNEQWNSYCVKHLKIELFISQFSVLLIMNEKVCGF